MTKEKYQQLLMNKKLTLLQLAGELKHITKACQMLGYSRQQYYNIKERYLKEGENGLRDRSRAPHRVPSRPSTDLERIVLDFILLYPSYSYTRVADSLAFEQGLYVSPGTVRGIFKRYQMNRFKDRLMYLEKEYFKRGFVLTREQQDLLSRISEKIEYQHIHAPYAGYLLAQDTFYVGYLKGVGKVYMQTVVDCANSFAFARLYNGKDGIVASHMLQDHVLPFYQSFNIPIHAILTDNGTEYCGSADHPFETLLWLFGIEHRNTKVKSPHTNGFVERFHKTVLNEFFKVAFRTKYYVSVDDLQSDLSTYLSQYNFKRAHHGYRTKGAAPATIFLKNMKPLALPSVA